MERSARLTAMGRGALARLVRSTVAGAREAVRSIPRSRRFLLLGVGLVLGAPAGLVVVEALAAGEVPTVAWALNDITNYPVTYAYLTVLTLVVMVVGWVLGGWTKRVRIPSVANPQTGIIARRSGARLDEEVKGTGMAPCASHVCALPRSPQGDQRWLGAPRGVGPFGDFGPRGVGALRPNLYDEPEGGADGTRDALWRSEEQR